MLPYIHNHESLYSFPYKRSLSEENKDVTTRRETMIIIICIYWHEQQTTKRCVVHVSFFLM